MAGAHPPARLRAELEHARADGVTFRVAWQDAVKVTLASTHSGQKAAWRAAFASTKQGWHSAYTGTPGPGESVRELLDAR